jgi:hypothetical protein
VHSFDSLTQPGASGGVGTVDGEVAAMSYASQLPGQYQTKSELAEDGIYFPNVKYGRKTGFMPTATNLVMANTIELALNSPLG